MKNHFFIFTLLLPLSVLCQNVDTASHIKKEKLLLGVLFTPESAYRNIISDNSINNKDIVNERNGDELSKLTYSLGFTLFYDLSDRWAMYTGAIYSDKGYKTATLEIPFPAGYYALGGGGNTWVPGATYSYNYHFDYIDIPVKAVYYAPAENFSFILSAGFSMNFHVADYLTYITTDTKGHTSSNTNQTSYEFNNVNFQGIASFGAKYNVTQDFTLILTPEFAYSITPLASTPIKEYLYSVGIDIGAFLRL